MEAKVKEEVPDKDYSQTQSVERRKPPSSGKERRSPEQDESRSSPALTAPAPPSPHNNGTNESSSPPLNEARGALQRLKRFLSALQQFAADVSGDAGERVKHHIYSLVSGSSSIEDFQSSVQECTNYPLRASVPGFLRALLPHAQRDLTARARAAKMAPLQYIRAHEHLILEPGGDSADIFSSQTNASLEPGVKRRASDPFYDGGIPQTNGAHHGVMDAMEYAPAPKRPHGPSPFLHPSPFLCPPLLPTNSSLYDYGHYHPAYHAAPTDGAFERRDGGITVRDVSSMNANFSDGRGLSSGGGNLGAFKNDDEWKNINTMLNCILSMVEKTKRALAILQQRGTEPGDSGDIKRAANEIMAAAVRQTEERVAEVRRRAEDAVNQVKRQALVDLQRAVGAAEARALELVAAERSKVERLLLERRHTPPGSPSPGPAAAAAPQPQPPPPPPPVPVAQQNCCWNCGRKAQETCSGCNAARYCGAFCQHKDWEHHHQVCSGREQKPNTVLTTSPPTTQTTTLSKTTRATTPITGTSENRLSLTTLNNAERMLSSNQERNIAAGNTERIALATLSTAQSLMGSLGGKK